MNYYETSLRRNRLALAIVPVAAALVVAGCGGGGSAMSPSSKAATTPSAKTAAAALRLAPLAPGRALVDAQGRTLYLFEADKGNASSCNGACASIWPPAAASGGTTGGHGLAAGKIATTKRSDGALQLSYNGHPLYRYAADQKPGDANGQGLDQFGGKWYVLDAQGTKIDND